MTWNDIELLTLRTSSEQRTPPTQRKEYLKGTSIGRNHVATVCTTKLPFIVAALQYSSTYISVIMKCTTSSTENKPGRRSLCFSETVGRQSYVCHFDEVCSRPFRALGRLGCGLCRTSMSSSLGSTAFLIFAVLSVVTLKELNIQVNEPYMVRSRFCTRHRMILTLIRTSRFTYPRLRHTATGTGPIGIRKSRHLPDCETVSLDLFAHANLLRPAMF